MTSQGEDGGHDVIRPEADPDSADEAHRPPAQPQEATPSQEQPPSTGDNSAPSANSSSAMKFRLRKTLKAAAAASGGNDRGDAGDGDADSNHWRRLRMTLRAAEAIQRHKKSNLQREDSFLKKFSTRNQRIDDSHQRESESDEQPAMWSYPKAWRLRRHLVIQHDGSYMFYWLGVVTLAVLYNMWTCIAREAFREIQSRCNPCWFTLDALCDVIYLLDIVVQFRTGYLDQGLMVYDTRKLARRYTRSRYLYVDLACLLPLDFLQFKIGIHPMVRFPRFLKLYRTFRFLHMLESRNPYPNLIRVGNLTHILFLGAHWFAAFYFLISEAEGFKGGWSYPPPQGEYASLTRKYLASLFWSTLTLTTIGDLPPPEGDWEYVFVIVSYLIGVFIFATIVGQVGNVITNRNASRQEFERLLDGAKVYMQTHNVPPDLQKRVQRWYDYVWSRGRLNGADINSLGLLPDKLKTELAIHVNLETLRKVTIFQECQPEFLHDLVLKMRAYIFTPGDLICRRGEVAREMFIIADGVVEIISESGTVLKQMGAGDFFGEIGILNLDGGINRRSADVRSVGFSELFVLSREDVLGALKDHPDAESIIRDYGQRRLREIEAHRQRVKPLQRQEAVNQLPTVHNSLLFSLRSLPTNRRRQQQQGQATDPAPPQSPRCASSGGSRRSRLATSPSQASEDSCAGGPGEMRGGGGSVRGRRPPHGSILDAVFGGLRRVFRRRTLGQKTTEETPLGGEVSRAAWGEEGGGAATGGRAKGAGGWGNPRMAQQQEQQPPPPAAAEGDGGGGGGMGGGGTFPSLLSKVLQQKLSSKPPGYQAVSTEEADACRAAGGSSDSTVEGHQTAAATGGGGGGEGSKGGEPLARGTLESPLRLDLIIQDGADDQGSDQVVQQTTAGIESSPSTSAADTRKPREDASNCSASLLHNTDSKRAGSAKLDGKGVGSASDQDGEGTKGKGMGLLLRSLVRAARESGVSGNRRNSSSLSNSLEESTPAAESRSVGRADSKEGGGNSGAVSDCTAEDGGGDGGGKGATAASSNFLCDRSERPGVQEASLSDARGPAAPDRKRAAPHQGSAGGPSARPAPPRTRNCPRGRRPQPLVLSRAGRSSDRSANSDSSLLDIESSGSDEDSETSELQYPTNLDLFASAHLNGLQGDRRGSLDRWRRNPVLPTIIEAESPSMRDLRVFMEDKLNRLEELHTQSVRTLSRLADTQEQLLALLQQSLPRHQQNTPEHNSPRIPPCCEETRL